jgi:hypothetical protein
MEGQPEPLPLPRSPSDVDHLIRAFTERFAREPNAEERAIFNFMRDLLARKLPPIANAGADDA